MSDPALGAVVPFWLDRPDAEALEIADSAARSDVRTLWIGEMATYDAFSLATAVGLRAPELGLRIGPLAAGVRSPVALALGLASVASLTGARVDLALGASSPAIVTGWHGRPWAPVVPRVRETVRALRPLLAGERVAGFRLRDPPPDTMITVAAFGPAMTRLAAREADAVVLNLVSPEHLAGVRGVVDAEAATVGRAPPRLAVWVPAALDPGPAALAQLAGQLAVYLAPPGYGEMFTALGFGALVQRARAGARRAELTAAVPRELLAHVCALGGEADVRARIAAYQRAGADDVAVVPSTAEDPGGAEVLAAVAG